MSVFYPPRPNSALIGLCQWLVPLLNFGWNRIRVDVDSADLKKLHPHRQGRWLILCNHPTFTDPAALFELSARLGERFHYLAAHEQFATPYGAWIQRLGCYSVRRGLADRRSLVQTSEILQQPQARLAIFPEGGCSFQNDTVMPLRLGGIQLALQTLSRLVTEDPQADIWVIPTSLYYRYPQDMQIVISNSLTRLERRLSIAGSAPNAYTRLRRIAHELLTRMEREYDHPNADEPNWTDRIRQLKLDVLQLCEQQVKLPPHPTDPMRERVYRVMETLQASPDQALQLTPGWNRERIQKALFRLLNFDAIVDGYVAQSPTTERFLDTITRLERDVFQIDKPQPKGFRLARFKLGDPISLATFIPAYRQNKGSVVQQLSEQVQQIMQQQLLQLADPA